MDKVVQFVIYSAASGTTPAAHHGLFCALVVTLALLAGCTARWQAPLESRGTVPPARQTVAIPKSATAYRVRRGDTLVSIAWRADLDWRQLAQWNRLVAPYKILPGQVLRLRPLPRTSTASARPPSQSANRVSPRPAPMAKPRSAPRPAKPKPKRSQPTRPAPKPPGATPAKRKLYWGWPTDGSVTVGYAAADPARKGIKIAGTLGQSIRAAERGSVVYSGSGLIGYGQLIIIKHNDKYLSAYGNNRKLLVKEGDQVAKGETIAEMGRANGGRSVLHFEIRREGEPVNPLSLLPQKRR